MKEYDPDVDYAPHACMCVGGPNCCIERGADEPKSIRWEESNPDSVTYTTRSQSIQIDDLLLAIGFLERMVDYRSTRGARVLEWFQEIRQGIEDKSLDGPI